VTTFSATVKARVEAELRDELEAEAERQERPVGNLVRRYLREGLERDRARKGHSRRV
jgi:predicted HicB family RNase H-like nuclease